MSYEFEDTCTWNVKAEWLDLFETDDYFSSPRRPVARCKNLFWWIQCYPNQLGFVKLFLCTSAGGFKLTVTATVLRSDVERQETEWLAKSYHIELGQLISHDKLRLGDTIKDGVFSIKCDVKFKIPEETIYTLNHKTFVKDSITISFLECQLDDNEIGEFDSTPKEFVKGSDKHQWQLKWFPAGDSFGGKRHISLFVEASTTETKTVTMSGIITVVGLPFKKKFNMLVEADSSSAFSKLISHDKLRRIGGIVDNKVTITCDATFHTFDFLCLN